MDNAEYMRKMRDRAHKEERKENIKAKFIMLVGIIINLIMAYGLYTTLKSC